ncbi:MAG: DUF1778 domain-containing protein [Thermoleophilia bacterium]
MTSRATNGRDHRLGVRITERERALLREASTAEGTTVSEFVLRHATRAAERVLADRREFTLAADRWEAFTAALDAPPKDVPGLRELLARQTVLDGE